MIEIASFTVIGLVILFSISFVTFHILKRKDYIYDFFNNLGKDVESIDFSDLTVEGYEYYKSTYAKRENKSALITPESAELISNYIPTYYENEKWLLRILRLIIDHRIRSKNLDDSLLYYLYCNGFRTGYNEIDIEVDRQDFDSIDKCNKYISKYKRKIHTSDFPSEPTQRWKYYKLLGKNEGATVRGVLYAKELMSESRSMQSGRQKIEENRILSDVLINLDSNQEADLLKRIHNYVLKGTNVKGKALGLLFVSLQELEYIETVSKDKIKASDFCHILRNTFPKLNFNDKGFYKYSVKEKLDTTNIKELEVLKDKLNILNRIS